MHSSIEQRQVFLWGDSFAKDKTTEDKRDPTVHPTVVYTELPSTFTHPGQINFRFNRLNKYFLRSAFG